MKPLTGLTHLTRLTAVLLLSVLAMPVWAQVSSTGETGATGASACTNLSQMNHSFMYVQDGPKSDRATLQIRPIGFLIVQSTQRRYVPFINHGTPKEEIQNLMSVISEFYAINEYDVYLDLLKDGSSSVRKRAVGSVSNVPRTDLNFSIENFTNLDPDTPYTAVLHVGETSKPVSRLCFRTAPDPDNND